MSDMSVMSETGSNQIYHTVFLPLNSTTALNSEQKMFLDRYVEEYGYYILDPRNLDTIPETLFNQTQVCTLLYYIFKVFLLHEHSIGLNVLNHFNLVKETRKNAISSPTNKRAKSSHETADKFSLNMSIKNQSKFVDAITDKALHCLQFSSREEKKVKDEEWKSKATYELFTNLVRDLYRDRDQGHVFGWGSEELIMGPKSASTFEDEQNAFEELKNEDSKSVDDSEEIEETGQILQEFYRHHIPRTSDWFRSRPGNKTSTAVIVLDNNFKYLGHVYVWPSRSYFKTLDMIGIRTSVLNLACREVRNVSHKIIASCLLFCLQYPANFKYLRIENPLPVMEGIAARLGFVNASRWSSMFILPEKLLGKLNPPTSAVNYDCIIPFGNTHIQSENDKYSKEDFQMLQLISQRYPKLSTSQVIDAAETLLLLYPHVQVTRNEFPSILKDVVEIIEKAIHVKALDKQLNK